MDTIHTRPGEQVLEIGSGHRPRPQSTILCDKFIQDDAERHGALKRHHKPMVAGDGHDLPFRDKAFDYVICSHVLEHADDVEQFLREITRIASRGYVETPSAVAEWMFGWPYHRWVFVRMGDRLRIARKQMTAPAGPVFHHLYNTDLAFQTVFYSYLPLFTVTLEWTGRISYEIVDEAELLADYPAIELLDTVIRPAQPRYRQVFAKHLRKRLHDVRNTYGVPLPQSLKDFLRKFAPEKN